MLQNGGDGSIDLDAGSQEILALLSATSQSMNSQGRHNIKLPVLLAGLPGSHTAPAAQKVCNLQRNLKMPSAQCLGITNSSQTKREREKDRKCLLRGYKQTGVNKSLAVAAISKGGCGIMQMHALSLVDRGTQ